MAWRDESTHHHVALKTTSGLCPCCSHQSGRYCSKLMSPIVTWVISVGQHFRIHQWCKKLSIICRSVDLRYMHHTICYRQTCVQTYKH